MKQRRSRCETEKVDVVAEVVTVRSWTSFADAFQEASKLIPKDKLLWDTQISQSADCGYELKLYFLKSVK